jgi:diguanylate cyclase (GGDEF)-like protein
MDGLKINNGQHTSNYGGKILVVDDEALNRGMLERLLAKEYLLSMSENAEDAWEKLNTDPDIELVLLDINMPGASGLELLRQVRTKPQFDHIPILIISGMSDEKTEMEGLSYGAADFIYKPFRPLSVKLRVKNHFTLINQRKELEFLSQRDALTGIYNRRAFMEKIETELARLSRGSEPLSILMIDIDYFKQFNDHYGHPEGDVVLKLVAQALQHFTPRKADVCARIGGEEFIILWPQTPAIDATNMAKQLLKSVELLACPHVKSKVSDYVTISAGGLTVSKRSLDVEAVMRTVDEALYQAKDNGRNRVEWVISLDQ